MPFEHHPATPEAGELLHRYEEEPSHVRHVAALADRLFTGLQSWHGHGEEERLWLHLAALLHDIGWSQTPHGKGHHKESARLIRQYPWQTLNPRAIDLIAQIARYHRKSLPSPTHEPYQALPAADQQLVDHLAGILRVADALDRTHRQIVTRLDLTLTETTATILITAPARCEPELAMAKNKGDLLQIALRRSLEFSRADQIEIAIPPVS